MCNDKKNPYHNAARREFFKDGAKIMAGTLFMPQWIKLLLGSNHAKAADPNCAASNASSMIPFITINLNGGAALQANYLPKLIDGVTPLDADTTKAGYSKMGMGKNPTKETLFGINDGFYAASGIIAGIKDAMNFGLTADTTTLDKTAFIAACVQSRDDSGENKMAVDGLLTKAGLVGTLLPNLGANRNDTGINHKAAFIPPPAPLVVSSISALGNSIKLNFNSNMNTIMNSTDGNDKLRMAKTMRRLSESQMKRLITTASDSDIKDLIDCMNLKNTDLANPALSSSSSMDPNSIAAIKEYWTSTTAGATGANSGTIPDNTVSAGVAFSVLNGWTGSGIIEFGGFDYHSGAGNRATQDASDRAAGRVIGNILRMAAILNKKVFIYVSTNGSVVSNDVADPTSTQRGWVSDFGPASCVYGIYFNPAGRATTNGNQIGGYTQGQITDTSFYTGSSPELTATSIFANYMHLNGMKSTFETIIGNRFDMSRWDSVVKFT